MTDGDIRVKGLTIMKRISRRFISRWLGLFEYRFRQYKFTTLLFKNDVVTDIEFQSASSFYRYSNLPFGQDLPHAQLLAQGLLPYFLTVGKTYILFSEVGLVESRDVGGQYSLNDMKAPSDGSQAKVANLREALFHECNKIAKEYELFLPSGQARLSTILAILSSSPSLCCAAKALRNRRQNQIDPYYTGRHSVAVGLIVDALYDGLTARKYGVMIGTEVPSTFGRLDILLEPTWHGVELRFNDHRIGIEVKTGLSIDLAQIFRYVLDVDSLILVRMRPRQVITIRQTELLDPLSTILSAWISRARRLLADKDLVCHHKKNDAPLRFLDSEALAQDIVRFTQDIHATLSSVVESVVRELERIEGT